MKSKTSYCIFIFIQLESEELAKTLSSSPENHQLLSSLQEAVENKEQTVRDQLEQKMAEQDGEQRNAPQDTQHQTEELSEQIKMLQEQLQEVSVSELLQLFLCVTQFYWENIKNNILSAHSNS